MFMLLPSSDCRIGVPAAQDAKKRMDNVPDNNKKTL